MTERELAVRRRIFERLAETGRPPVDEDRAILTSLAEQHVIVLDVRGTIAMAHPFAAPGGATLVESGDRAWWGNCAWDGLGIVAALGLEHATVTSTGVTLEIAGADIEPADAVFHVAVPARHWWDDIGHT